METTDNDGVSKISLAVTNSPVGFIETGFFAAYSLKDNFPISTFGVFSPPFIAFPLISGLRQAELLRYDMGSDN